jgi:redox-regulated HSP33 family molecular chaperone
MSYQCFFTKPPIVEAVDGKNGVITLASSDTIAVENSDKGQIKMHIIGSGTVSGVASVNNVWPYNGNVTVTDENIAHEFIKDGETVETNLSEEVETLKTKAEYLASIPPSTGHANGELIVEADLRINKNQKVFGINNADQEHEVIGLNEYSSESK